MVNAFPSLVRQSGLDLPNRNILWTSVTSAGIKIPLPIDSCCSISLVSKKRADLVSQNCPDLKFTKLATPLSVSVARAESKPQASCRFLSCVKMGVGGGGGGAGAITPSVPLSFYKQLLPLPKPVLLLLPPHQSPRPPNKNFLVVDKTLLGRCFV